MDLDTKIGEFTVTAATDLNLSGVACTPWGLSVTPVAMPTSTSKKC